MPLSDPIRFSNLKHIARSPAHYHDAVTRGRDDKPWLRGGRGLHCVLFNQTYAVFDGGKRQGKAWENFCEFIAETEAGVFGKTEVILAKELPAYEAMAASIRAELQRLNLSHLLEGDVEERIEWEWLGRKCAGTPDVQRLILESMTLTTTDVKTTCNADPRKFHWDARKFGYSEQLAWYGQGRELKLRAEKTILAADDMHHEQFVIAVEKTPPYPVVVWKVTEKMREQAEKTLRIWFEQLLSCEASNCWPGYVQCVQALDVLESDSPLTLQIGDEEVEVSE